MEYNLPPETKHLKKIRDSEFEFLVDFINKKVQRRNLVNSNYNDKSIAELSYIFENKLYDTNVKYIGEANFLGKDCSIYEIQTGIYKLEVYEWKGVYLKTKGYFCTYVDNCAQPLLIFEEIATQISENVPITDSIFEYPDIFELISN